MYRAAVRLAVSSLPFVLVAACMDMGPEDGTSTDDVDVHDMRGAPEPHLHYAKGEARPGGGGSGSPLLTYHNGPVIHASKTEAIFWGSQWNDASFAGDKITGIDALFGGWNNSGISSASTEYYDTSGNVTAASTYLGHVIDASTPPRKALSVNGAVAEACAQTGNNPDPSAVYFIYTSTGAGHVNYCAWHSWGNCSNGAPIQVAYMPNLDGIAGCDPGDTSTGHSEGLAALGNVTSHELSEAITDPRGTGWVDSSGAENGDKCAWTFTSLETLSNGSHWKMQQEWSNAAYNAGQGSPRGCIP
jgi:hypothetical protein